MSITFKIGPQQKAKFVMLPPRKQPLLSSRFLLGSKISDQLVFQAQKMMGKCNKLADKILAKNGGNAG